MQQISFVAQNRELDGDWPRGAGRHFHLIPGRPSSGCSGNGDQLGRPAAPGQPRAVRAQCPGPPGAAGRLWGPAPGTG